MQQNPSTDQTEFQKRLRKEALQTDKDDIMAVLMLRFGIIPTKVEETIQELRNPDRLERLVLVAANVPTFSKFVEELNEGSEAFRLVGEGFNPLG